MKEKTQESLVGEGCPANNPTLIGILNITPDSFSDGGAFLDPEAAYDQAQTLLNDGAALIDVGGDSTRPGSACIGVKTELKRITPTLKLFSEEKVPFAVDTHHPEVAEVALQYDAMMINDISGGRDERMLQILSQSSAQFVLMHSRCPVPHDFSYGPVDNLLPHINAFFHTRIEKALSKGIAPSRIILDPGLGKFVSHDPLDSWKIIRNFSTFQGFGFPLYLGASRKGFLQLPLERNIQERDMLSAYVAEIVRCSLPDTCPLYVRTHNVSMVRLVAKIGQSRCLNNL